MSDPGFPLGPEGRTLSIGINVDAASKLPKVGEYVAKFLTHLTEQHGLFTVSIAVSVEPTEASAIGPIEPVNDDDEDSDFEIIFIPEKEGE
ncbi:hypothetical protein M3231_15355 [Neobacillus mesonae]|nr:hypothetical protein [Neobacillus mesonae]